MPLLRHDGKRADAFDAKRHQANPRAGHSRSILRIMKRTILILLSTSLLAAAPLVADTYEAMFPSSFQMDDVELGRKGVSKLVVGYIFNVYVAAFYQEADSGPEQALADRPRHLEIEYLRDISKEAFIDAAEDMLSKQHSPAAIAAVRDGISGINKLYQDVKKGDRYALTYRPGSGTELTFNGQSQGIIPGAEFARIYFTIWLGEKHPYQSFRDRLVGAR